MNALPESWARATGSDAFDFVTSGSRGWAAHYAEDGSPFIRIGNLNHGTTLLDLSAVQHVLPPQGAEADRTRLRANDILVSITAEIGMVGLVPEGLADAYINQHIALCRPNPLLDARYLAWYLASEADGKRQLLALRKGATKAGLGLDDIRRVEFAVAPRVEQQRIVAKLNTLLGRVDACRERLKRVGPLIKRLERAILLAGATGALTQGWRTKQGLPEPLLTNLGKVIQVSSGNFLPAKDMAANGTIPVFGGNGINGFHSEANVSSPTLVIGRVGYYCGSVHLTPDQAWITDNALLVRHDPDIATTSFLQIALKSINLRANDSSTAQSVISGTKIYPLPLLLPHIDEQREVSRRVSTLLGLVEGLQIRLARARAVTARCTSAVLAKAFRGELVPQDPADEPASALLARLRASAPTSAPAAAGGKPRGRPRRAA